MADRKIFPRARVREDEGLRLAIERAGGVRVLARMVGVSHAAISQWARVPVDRLKRVSEITGIPREVLRPDIFGV